MNNSRYDEVADFYVAEVGDSVTDPATSALLQLAGDVSGQAVLDVACGQGRVSRELARRGAKVTGADLSSKLVERAVAEERTDPLGIRFVVADVTDLRAAGPSCEPGGSSPGDFDTVVCNFGLSDIDDLSGALHSVFEAVRPGGRFIFSILHPCFPGWGPEVASAWQPGPPGYFREGLWHTEAVKSRIRRSVGANHRMISTYLNSLSRAGFAIDEVREPEPPASWTTKDPALDPVPTFLAIRSVRPGSPG